MADLTFTVTGIHCAGCANNIETGLMRLDGVRGVSATPDGQKVTVRFDERRLDATGIAAQLERLGFPGAEDGR